MNAPCDDYRDKLAELITGGLPDAEHEAIERHLSECAACREYEQALLADHRLVSGFVGSMDDRVARLESRVSGEKSRIGLALYPLVERAEITVELPEVQVGVEEIARLREEIRQARIRIEELERDPGPPALPPPNDAR